MKMILVTGGAGFIGSNFILHILSKKKYKILNVDKLTYAGNLNNLNSVKGNPNYYFLKGDISNSSLMKRVFSKYKPDAIVNFAAESHVDRSIKNPYSFIETNIFGTFILLQEAREFWEKSYKGKQNKFRFLHISTDEVFGELEPFARPFKESDPYMPNSPYAASKASSDHLVRAFYKTYGLPTIISNCSNNYGRFQYPEKLIPLTILSALKQKSLPVYGNGSNIRDWLFVEDHCEAVYLLLENGLIGETYNIGGNCEISNIKTVKIICEALDKLRPRANMKKYFDLVRFVKDRPGHDFRYSVDFSKIRDQLGWFPKINFQSGIRKTIEWYINNSKWVNSIKKNK